MLSTGEILAEHGMEVNNNRGSMNGFENSVEVNSKNNSDDEDPMFKTHSVREASSSLAMIPKKRTRATRASRKKEYPTSH